MLGSVAQGNPGAVGTAMMIVGTRLLQQSLAALLERQAGVTVVGSCSTAEAVALATERSPDVVVMELRAAGRPALSQVSALMRLRPAPRLIIVGRDVSPQAVTTVVDLGVDACVSEEDGGEQLVAALDAVRRSERHIGPMICEVLQRPGDQSDPDQHDLARVQLTPREREVLTLIAQAKTERQIATYLGLSPKTVHTHRTSMMHKLGVHNVIALVRRAVRLGLADL